MDQKSMSSLNLEFMSLGTGKWIFIISGECLMFIVEFLIYDVLYFRLGFEQIRFHPCHYPFSLDKFKFFQLQEFIN